MTMWLLFWRASTRLASAGEQRLNSMAGISISFDILPHFTDILNPQVDILTPEIDSRHFTLLFLTPVIDDLQVVADFPR